MSIQVQVWVPPTDDNAALVELVQTAGGSGVIPLATLQPGSEGRQFTTFPGTALRVSEVPKETQT